MHSPAKPTLKDHILTNLLRILPQHLLAAGMYRLARIRWAPLKRLIINTVIKKYGVNLAEAKDPDPENYASFNAFFTRALRDDARPMEATANAIVSPVDGKVSQAAPITDGRLIQAKGHDYSLLELLAGDERLAEKFSDGTFSTIYLSPKDYHRIHMPWTGNLEEMVFVPGQLFSVSEATTQLVPSLFARNERVICSFDTAAGPMAVILVGAIFVGSMETVWHGEVRGPRNKPTHWHYHGDKGILLEKGAELGRFNMGSTVILLYPKGMAEWQESLQPGASVRMGEQIGSIRPDQEEN